MTQLFSKRLIALLASFMILIPSSYQLSSLQPIQNLLKSFDEKIDINFLFYSLYRDQKLNPFHCNAQFGPHCKSVNGHSLLDMVDSQLDTLEYQSKKEKVLEYLDQISSHVNQQLKLMKNDGFVLVSNDFRDSILGKNDRNPVIEYNIDILLTFDDFPSRNEDTLITTPYLYFYGLKKSYGGFKEKVTPIDQDHLEVRFNGILQPNYQKIYSQKSISEFDEYEKANANNEKQNLDPTGLYLYTNEKKSGEMKFSRPVKIRHFFLRKHNLFAYQRQRQRLGLDPNIVEYTAIGKLNGVEVDKFSKLNYHAGNKWVKIVPQKSVYVDSITFEENTDIDNLYFAMRHTQKDAAGGSTTTKTTINSDKATKEAKEAQETADGSDRGVQFYQFKIPSNSKFATKEELVEFFRNQWDELKKKDEDFDVDFTFEEVLDYIEQALDSTLQETLFPDDSKDPSGHEQKKKKDAKSPTN